MWLESFDNHGGLAADDRDTLLAAIAQALDNPTCCREPSQRFLDQCVTNVDGHTAQRMSRDIVRWVRSTTASDGRAASLIALPTR